MKKVIMLLGIACIFFSCSSNNHDVQKEQKATGDSAVKSENELVKPNEINADSIIKVIDVERNKIENELKAIIKTSLPTKDLRAQIKQKWSKIDFYTDHGQIVRIKSYPYEKISHRTEEFYFQNRKLILAFIEDEGFQFTGKSDKRIGKTYYFFNDKLIKEENPTNEKETTIRNSDSERLLQEAQEYLELFPKK
jgi:hypothetical protein